MSLARELREAASHLEAAAVNSHGGRLLDAPDPLLVAASNLRTSAAWADEPEVLAALDAARAVRPT